jgi:hypothetical protein
LRKVIIFFGFLTELGVRPGLQVDSGSPFDMVMVFLHTTYPPTTKGTIKNG